MACDFPANRRSDFFHCRRSFYTLPSSSSATDTDSSSSTDDDTLNFFEMVYNELEGLSRPKKKMVDRDRIVISANASEHLGDMAEAIDLTGDGGVLKTIVKSAKPVAIAPSESLPLVDVHYEGSLAETGEVFDTTHEDNTIFTFEIGKGSVIKAWDVALRTMKVGEVAKITCKSDYAYGSAGSPPEIPPDATLIFEVELVACRPRKGSSVASASDERARLDELKKQRGMAAAQKEEEKKKREEAKAAAAARIQAKMESKKGGKGKGKGK